MKNARESLIVLLVSVVSVLAIPGLSLGGSISYVLAIEQVGDASFALLPQFDPSLGLLQSVTFAGTWNVTTEVAFGEPPGSVSYGGIMVLGVPNLDQTVYGPVVGGTQIIDQAGISSFSSGLVGVSGSLDVTSAFYGNGNISVFPGWLFESSPMGEFVVSQTSGEITFTYTFVVPEPPGFILASIAAILPLSLSVRRRLTSRAESV